MGIGEGGLGGLARAQLEMARKDPRLGRGRGAMIADFWDSIEEIERVRMLGVWGTYELARSLEREEHELGVKKDDEGLAPEQRRALQAAWERGKLADAERSAGNPQLNAQALIGMTSALDAFVEDLVASRQAFYDKLISDALSRLPEASDRATTTDREILEKLQKRMRTSARVLGVGIERYEKPLSLIGVNAPPDRPIPEDLAAALAELGSLRNALVHRAARIDERALAAAPTLSPRYKDGDLIRISTPDYRIYSAAVRCYAAEIGFRGIRHWPEVSEERDGPHLGQWRDHYRIGA